VRVEKAGSFLKGVIMKTESNTLSHQFADPTFMIKGDGEVDSIFCYEHDCDLSRPGKIFIKLVTYGKFKSCNIRRAFETNLKYVKDKNEISCFKEDSMNSKRKNKVCCVFNAIIQFLCKSLEKRNTINEKILGTDI